MVNGKRFEYIIVIAVLSTFLVDGSATARTIVLNNTAYALTAAANPSASATTATQISPLESAKLLLQDGISALEQDRDTNKALAHLKLASQQLISVPSSTALSSSQNTVPSKTLAVKVPATGKTVGSTAASPHSSAISSGNVYNMVFGGKTYPIRYQISGANNKLSSITTTAEATTAAKKVNNPAAALYINIFSTSNGRG